MNKKHSFSRWFHFPAYGLALLGSSLALSAEQSNILTQKDLAFLDRIKNLQASYSFEFSGPQLNSLSGTPEYGDDGVSFALAHGFSLGYRTGPTTTISLAQGVTQNINNRRYDPNDPSNTDSVYWGDPSFTFRKSKLLEYTGGNVSSYLRYYFPASQANRNAVRDASMTDAGNGAVRAGITPSINFSEELSGSIGFVAHHRFSKNSDNDRRRLRSSGNPSRRDKWISITPELGYSLTPKWSVSASWSTGTLVHTTFKPQDSWTDIYDGTYGQVIEVGAGYSASQNLSLGAYLDLGPGRIAGAKRSALGLTASYGFF